MFLTFSNTILLFGLAGAVVPLVLHLLSRARYQSVEWGAMLFLDGTESRQQHNARLSQFMLLAVRMAMVGLLAIALAGPVLQHWSPDVNATGAALRLAMRGELLCIGGAVACGAAVVGVAFLAGAAIKRSGLRWWQTLHLLAAVAAGVGLVSASRRAAHWQGEVRNYQALQAQAPPAQPADGALRSRVDAAIVLDCSPSMDFEENGHTRFSVAQGAAKQVLAGLHRGDRAMLMLLGQRQSDADLEPTADLQSIADRIEAAHVGHDAADIAQALLKARQVLDRDGHIARDLYIVADRQALSWRGVDDYFMSNAWPDAAHAGGPATRIFFVPVGNSDADNVAVESIELVTAPAIVGQPAQIAIGIRNYGATPRAALPLAVSVNGRPVFETTISLPPDRIARVLAPVQRAAFTSAGSQVITAEVKSSGYTDDDRLESVVEAIEPIKVLVLSGDEWQESPGQFRSESDFLKLALAPFQAAAQKGADPCKVDVLPAEQWPDVDLKKYQVLVLANIERFTDAQSRAIEQYVYGGGGVLIAPGSLSRAGNYNDQLWREGSGILPAQLEDATSADGADATSIVGYDPSSPVFQFLHDRPELMLSATIGRYFPADATTADAHVLAWYTSGSPFLIESRAGRGKVLLMTTSLDADWSTLPLSNFYLPFVQSAVRYLAAGTLPSRDVRIGEPINVTFDDILSDSATIELPDGSQRQVPIAQFGAGSELHFTDTRDPGIYRVHVRDQKGDRVLAFAARAPRDESDLTQLTEKQWARLEEGLHVRRIDPTERPVAAAVAGDRDGYDLAPWMLAGALLLGAAELGLARYWSRDAF